MKIELEISDQVIIDKVTEIIAEEVAEAFHGERGAVFEDRIFARNVKNAAIEMGRKCLAESKDYIIDRIIELSTKELCKKAYASAADDLKKQILGR